MAYSKNLKINPNNVVSISGSLITLTGSLSGTEIHGTTAQFTTVSASVVSASQYVGLNLTASVLSASELNIDFIDFNTSSTNPPFQTGRIYYNTDTGDLSYDTVVNGIAIELGQQTVVKAKNASGSPISKGKLVRIFSGSGVNPLITTASWENDNNSANTLGMVMQTVNNNAFTFVLLNGVIKGIDLSSPTFAEGDILYLSSSGDYTNIKPVAPKHLVKVGEVVWAQSINGTAFINIQNGYELDELHNVSASSPLNGDLLVYNSGSELWNNSKTLSGSYIVTGSLTVNGKDLLNITYQQEIFVAKNGSDTIGNGSLLNPFLTISGAMAAIADATPSKRYAIRVAAGDYTESGNFDIKPNVFIVGEQRDVVKISATSFRMSSLFNTGSGVDNRSGFLNCTLSNACNFDWNTVQSPAGKLYFSAVQFNSTVNLNGYNNGIAQAQFDSCVIFGAFTVSGINVGVYTNNVNYGNISLSQHASLPSILQAAGGYCAGNITATTTVSNFNRRCSLFLRSFSSENLTVDGPSSYADFTLDSASKNGATSPNGGTLVPINAVVSQRIVPNQTNAHNSGDIGKEWFFNFSYVFSSTGNELYLSTCPSSSYGPNGVDGHDIWITPDLYGLDANVDGGDVIVYTADASGTGTRGALIVDARVMELTGSTSLSGNVLYTPANASHWNPQPTTIKEAIDRIAAAIYALSGNNPIN